MSFDQTPTAVGVESGERHGVLQPVADPKDAVHESSTRAPARLPTVALASVPVRSHKVVLTGELHRTSAPLLEREIERLCAEGVTRITLDLRELAKIDSIGVAVIAYRSRLCRRRGYELVVIPGSPLVHRALEQAGATGLIAPREAKAAKGRDEGLRV